MIEELGNEVVEALLNVVEGSIHVLGKLPRLNFNYGSETGLHGFVKADDKKEAIDNDNRKPSVKEPRYW